MKKIYFLLLLLSTFWGYSFADEDVNEIVNKANLTAYYGGYDGRAVVTMTITDSQQRERKRVFKILRLDVLDGSEQKYYVYFLEPSDVRDMVYMVWKQMNKEDDRWMYLSALDLVKRISASDKRSSFVGSNFVYEDISGRDIDLDTHELIFSEGLEYKIRNTPKDLENLEFFYFDVYINKENFMPVKAEYYDQKGKLTRVVEALEVKDIQGHPTVIKSKARDLITGSETIIEFSDVEYDIGIDDSVFTERYLRNPPRKWLK